MSKQRLRGIRNPVLFRTLKVGDTFRFFGKSETRFVKTTDNHRALNNAYEVGNHTNTRFVSRDARVRYVNW